MTPTGMAILKKDLETTINYFTKKVAELEVRLQNLEAEHIGTKSDKK